MTQNTKIQKIKMFIKISIVVGVLSVFVVLGIFIHPTLTFENADMKKWSTLNDHQRVLTVERVIKNVDNQELLFKCVDKIASLPDSAEMLIRDAVVLCYGGIQMNAESDEE